MNTPIADFVRRYAASDAVRFHMPGHKGRPFLGCEPWDITEIAGADALYEAEGIIAESEKNAGALFGSRRTCYATEGASHAVSGSDGRKVSDRGGCPKYPPRFYIRRRIAGLGGGVALAGGEPFSLRLSHLREKSGANAL